MNLSAQVVTTELRRGLVHLNGRTATSEPPGAISFDVMRTSLLMFATARAVTTSALPLPRSSSARAWWMVTLSRPRSSTTSMSHSTRRAMGSARCTSSSGRQAAITMPGRPEPEPTSRT